MRYRNPIEDLATHRVENQPTELTDYDLFASDVVLQEAVARHGVDWGCDRLAALGATLGQAETLEWGRQANRHTPVLHTHDRFGHRIDEVEYHPAYHQLMSLWKTHGLGSIAWTAEQPGGHTMHAAMNYLAYQVEAGVMCPSTMNYAAIPTLRHQPDVAETWEPLILANHYDPRFIPVAEKTSATIGMAMTEKQGGSDVRANTSRATPIGRGGPGEAYEIVGHKWFCSAPMCDGILTLAYTADDLGMSCFLVPRWTPDGSRNRMHIQRLKEKLGNRSNASSEIEYHGAWAVMIGEEGRGIRAIMDMVQHTRLDVATWPAALMRQATIQAIHHCMGRNAFQNRLIRQPMMTNVLADLSLESEAAITLMLRIAAAFDRSKDDPKEAHFARIAVAIAKYWLNKRVVPHIHEALECLGGAGYVEESDMPRLYREAPLNGIWEGAGNVMCLDIMRALQREPESIDALFDEITSAAGDDRTFDTYVTETRAMLQQPGGLEPVARVFAERTALALQASLLKRFAPGYVADAFCRSRLDGARMFGTLPPDLPMGDLVARAWPAAA